MRWRLSNRAAPDARAIADRHYNRQKIGADQFVPPGRCIVLVIPDQALWVTSWPYPEYVKHAWAGAWVNSCFRNERRDLHLSSELILEALAATHYFWKPPPRAPSRSSMPTRPSTSATPDGATARPGSNTSASPRPTSCGRSSLRRARSRRRAHRWA